MEFRVETDLSQCQKLWQEFSPQFYLFDLWEYRFCFYQGYGYSPYFIVGKEKGKVIGILPLWFERKEGYYTFFGGTFPEPNTFFIKEKAKIAKFLEQTPKETKLKYIASSEAGYYRFKESGPKFYLEMSRYNQDVDQFISSFSKKHRKNLRYDLRQLQKQKYSFRYNYLEDFEKMVSLNQKRFEKTSDFNEMEMVKSMKILMETADKQAKLNLVSVMINDQVQAVELAVIYNHCYYVLCGGHNLEIENIGKLLIIEHIKNALNKNISKLDFLSTDSGWKKLWHLETETLFEFSR